MSDREPHDEPGLVTLSDESERERPARARGPGDLRALLETVAHDVPAPLRSARIHLEILRRRHGERLGAEGHDAVDRALEACVEGQVRLRELVEILRVELEPIQKGTVDLERVAADVVRTTAARATSLGARVEVGALPSVRTDAALVRRLLRHAVDDALDQRADAEPRVRIVAAPSRTGTVALEVIDDGRTLEAADAVLVLQPFRRRGPARPDDAGLGLAVVDRAAARLGASVVVAPRAGGGVVLRVELPTDG